MRRFISAVMAMAFLAMFSLSHAQTWPSQPITVIVPFPPGGTTDRIIRLAQPHLQKTLNTPIIVENRGGASGSIGTLTAVRAPANGYTFLLVFDTHGVNPSLIPNLPYDTLKDLDPVMLIGTSPMVLTAHPNGPYQSFDQVLKSKSGSPPPYGTIGAGSLAHLAMLQVASESGTPLTHVAYKGGGPLVSDALAGHVPLAIGSVALLMPNIVANRLKPIAVTSAERYRLLPDVPTMAESGISNFDAEAWWGLLAPRGTPKDIVAKFHAAFTEALNEPSVKKNLEEAGLEIRASDAETFGAFVEREVKRWAEVVKTNNITIGQ